MIDLTERQMQSEAKRVKAIKSVLAQRMHDATDLSQASHQSLLLPESPRNPQLAYTLQNLQDISKHAQNLGDKEEIIRDSVYQSEIDREYLEQREKLLKRESNFSLPKKYACLSEGIMATRNRDCGVLQIPENEVPVRPKLLLARNFAHSAVCQVCSEDHTGLANKLLSCSVTVRDIL